MPELCKKADWLFVRTWANQPEGSAYACPKVVSQQMASANVSLGELLGVSFGWWLALYFRSCWIGPLQLDGKENSCGKAVTDDRDAQATTRRIMDMVC